MSSLISRTVKNHQGQLLFVDAAVTWALEPLEMTVYIYTYIYIPL